MKLIEKIIIITLAILCFIMWKITTIRINKDYFYDLFDPDTKEYKVHCSVMLWTFLIISIILILIKIW